jgi:hypothetical protein
MVVEGDETFSLTTLIDSSSSSLSAKFSDFFLFCLAIVQKLLCKGGKSLSGVLLTSMLSSHVVGNNFLLKCRGSSTLRGGVGNRR